MGEAEMARIAAWIDEVCDHVKDESRLETIASEVAEFCAAFPAPGIAFG
jgi:glycine hydroxymethyltransferase